MNVLWLAPHPIPDEVNSHPAPWITSLANELSRSGIKLTILTHNRKAKKEVQSFDLSLYKLIVIKAPSTITDVASFFSIRVLRLKNYLKETIADFDVVHVHGTEHQYASALIGLPKSTPVIISIQGLLYKYKKYINDLLSIRRIMWEIGSVYEKNEIKGFSNFACRTIWDKSSVLELNKNARIFQIWEPLRSEFYSYVKTFAGKDILFSGGVNSLKGLDKCLEAVDLYLEQFETRLHVIGPCSPEDIAEMIERLKLKTLKPSDVVLHGLVDAGKMIGIYEECFCLLHPSLIDNSPNSVCEAQISGLPVIANNVGGLKSLIDNNETGILISGDAKIFSEALIRLKTSPEFWQRISKGASEAAKARHDLSTITQATLDAYQLLKKRRESATVI